MSTETPDFYDLSRWFISTRERKVYVGPKGCYTVYDNAHSVKYVCPIGYVLLDDGSDFTYDISTDVAEWLISELGENDGYDVVLLQHDASFITRKFLGDTEEHDVTGNQPDSNQYRLRKLLGARKNKQSGTFVDYSGVEHTYDFTNCKHEFLVTLHGHAHRQEMTTSEGLTTYAADWYGNDKTCTFGLIDRLNSKITLWVFNATSCLDPLELPI